MHDKMSGNKELCGGWWGRVIGGRTHCNVWNGNPAFVCIVFIPLWLFAVALCCGFLLWLLAVVPWWSSSGCFSEKSRACHKTVSTTLAPSSPWIRGAVVSHTTQMANVSEVTAQVRCPSALALGWAVPVAVSAAGVYNFNPGGHLGLQDGCTWVVVCLCSWTGAKKKPLLISCDHNQSLIPQVCQDLGCFMLTKHWSILSNVPDRPWKLLTTVCAREVLTLSVWVSRPMWKGVCFIVLNIHDI